MTERVRARETEWVDFVPSLTVHLSSVKAAWKLSCISIMFIIYNIFLTILHDCGYKQANSVARAGERTIATTACLRS